MERDLEQKKEQIPDEEEKQIGAVDSYNKTERISVPKQLDYILIYDYKNERFIEKAIPAGTQISADQAYSIPIISEEAGKTGAPFMIYDSRNLSNGDKEIVEETLKIILPEAISKATDAQQMVYHNFSSKMMAENYLSYYSKFIMESKFAPFK